MTLTERMMGSLQASQGNILSLMGSGSAQKTPASMTSSDFDKILDSKLSHSNGGSYMNRNDYRASWHRRDSRPEPVRAGTEPRYKTFNEANNHNKQVKASATEKNDVSKRADNTERAEKNTKASDKSRERDRSENIIQVLAQMFGLDVMDLRKIFDEAGLDLGPLNSMQTITGIAAELSQLLGLSSDQQSTLEDMLNLAGQLFELPEAQDNALVMQDELTATSVEYAEAFGDADSDAASLEDYHQMTDESLLEQLRSQIKQRLNEYAKLLEEDSLAAEDSLKNLLLPLLEKSAMKEQIQLSSEQEAGPLDIEAGEMNITELSTEEAKEESQSTTAEESGQELNTKAKEQTQVVIPQTRAAINDSQSVFSAFPQANQTVSGITAHSLTSTNGTTTEQILSQILDEAQVILTPEKSEMVMELQPESLGKLSLKVVTEKGIVMAKFVAESQQVKEVLESNMQLLKDALQKQGLDVQGFNVSVRQDSANNSGNSWQYDKADWTSNRSVRNTAGIGTQYPEFPQTADQSNPYIWENSTINLTA